MKPNPKKKEAQNPKADGDFLWEKRAPRWPKVVAAVLVVGGITASLVFWKRSAIRQFRNDWSAANHLEEAREAFDGGDYRVSLNRSLTAQGLKPGDLDALRLQLLAAREIDDYRRIPFAGQLFYHPNATNADRAQALGAVNDVGNGRSFQRLYRSLSEESRQDPAIQKEWLHSLLLVGEPEKMLNALPAPAEGAELNADLAVLKCQALFATGSPENDRAAGFLAASLLPRLSQGAESNPDLETSLLETLDGLAPDRFPPEVATELRSILQTVEPDRLLRFAPLLDHTLLLAQQPDRREATLDNTVATLARTQLEPLCLWLEKLGETERILALLDDEKYPQRLRSPVAFECKARALVAAGRQEEALTLLEYPPDTGDRIATLAMKAGILKAMGRATEKTSAWQAAMIEANKDKTRNRFLQVAGLASEAGEGTVLVEALVASCRNRLGIMPPAEQISWLFAYLMKNDRPEDLLTVTRRLLQAESNNPILMNNAIYLTVISSDGESVTDEMVTTAEWLAENHPQYPETRATKALLYTLTGRPEEALAVYRDDERTAFGWQQFHDPGRATFSFVLAHNGPKPPFANVVLNIDWTKLSSMERRFFEPRLERFLASTKAAKEQE